MQRKQLVQSRLKKELNVRVDQVLQGHGTTNTGNLARRCLGEPEKFARCLEIDQDLVSNIALIISLFRSKKILDYDKVEALCRSTYELHYELYPWSQMSPTLHKLLRHGCEIARTYPMPPEYFAEDCVESWHKLHRRNLLQHARQNSREHRILDMFNRAVYMSDPTLSLIYAEKRIKKSLKIKITQRMTDFFE